MTYDLNAAGQRAKLAARALAKASSDEKNRAVLAIADALEAHSEAILAANARDLEAARARGLAETLIRDRFDLTSRMGGIIRDVRKVAELPDPVGTVITDSTLANGLNARKVRTPIGVIGMIYEARPNVTADCAVLALKTGNASILRGGSEVFHSNMAVMAAISGALHALNLPHVPADSIQFIESTDRAYVEQLLKLSQFVDMIIPRGGQSLHDFCRQNATIPVITGGLGIVHQFVDDTANLDHALSIAVNAKTQRPSVCNALDTLLVHEAIAGEFLPRAVQTLAPMGVTFRAEPRALALVDGLPGVQPAGEQDFDTEWMQLILGLKVVDGLDDAIEHINAHSTFHSEAIITETPEHADRFVREIDAAAVFVNTSTRFNDGSALGLGAEIAVSTQKLHARGPMALEELTTYKWVVVGSGQTRP
ncbi:MAG: glutamate-5-semialdehyde dehydrogenase [Pleurocapsa minor GSE-CHR-MK-17-07R]|jgi:glutamate-5-semialdehyde dehydrogenase|nr:glutamate-5-semialdehyde dehydrogenase [Pleurocapsa minor GSE-CHR-MK 17-07R]